MEDRRPYDDRGRVIATASDRTDRRSAGMGAWLTDSIGRPKECPETLSGCKAMPIYRVFDLRSAHRRIREWRRSVLRTIGLLGGVVGVCALGLSLLDTSGRPLYSKLYGGLWNALNLITTLGDFSALDGREKSFMMLTMVFFLVVGGYALTRLSGILSSDAVLILRENKNVKDKLSHISGHVIVVGFGALGQRVAQHLREAGEQLVILERSADLAGQASDLGYLVVQGDAGVDEAILDHSGVDRARGLVVTTGDPDRKLVLTLMARARNPSLKIAVTGTNEGRCALLRRAGASEVVTPDDLIAGALVDRLGKGA
jgi:voltage-gated potassium channel